jgi:cyclopropane-fatty-acyl-phospholipid synthase
VRREDYRELTGRYDKLVSIEMVEAVGHEYLDRYFAQCSALLENHGMMLLQAITIQDQHYDAARRSVDFIRKHIFPGSCIPSVASLCGALAAATDMKLFHLEDIGPHYATTLARWRENLARNLTAARELGLSEEFLRKWEFYFRYCEAGFAERVLGDVQALLVKPGARPPAVR